MEYLAREAFRRACELITREARPLDRAMFEFRFLGAPAGPVIAELAAYQNADGGFGRALEPDVRTPTSSSLATGLGLCVLEEVGCSADHPLVRAAVGYLLATFEPGAQVWRVVPEDANDFPHAPWWHDAEGSLARTFDDFVVIPRAQLVGLLYNYSGLVPDSWLEQVTERTVASIETLDAVAFEGGGDTLRFALDLAETGSLPSRFKHRLVPRLRELALTVVCRDPRNWDNYCAPPLKLATTPRSVVADLLWDELQVHLDYLVEHQTAEGAWEPNWNWNGLYPGAWEQARQEWRGHLALETLTTLQAFGRIEGSQPHRTLCVTDRTPRGERPEIRQRALLTTRRARDGSGPGGHTPHSRATLPGACGLPGPS